MNAFGKTLNIAGEQVNPATEEKQDNIITLLKNNEEVAKGNVPGQKIYMIPGRKNNISNTDLDDLSQIPGTTFIPNPGGIQLEVVSDNDEDGGAGTDTGALTLHIEYLDTSGNEQSETITMNGVTPVSTVATNIDKVQWIHVVTVGTNNVAVGNISLQTVGGGTVYEYIQAGGNQSLSGRYHIPNAKTGMLLGWHASGITKIIDIRLRATVDRATKGLQEAFNFIDNMVLNDSTGPWVQIEQLLPSGSTIKMSALSNGAGGDAGGMFKVKVIDD